MPVIGFLSVASPDAYRPMAAAFRQALREAGFIDGQNITIEYRWAEQHVDRLPGLAADLVQRRVDVIAAVTTEAAVVAKAASNYTDLPEITWRQIEHFFAHYKDLEGAKWVTFAGWGDSSEAKRLITEAIDRSKKLKQR